MPFVPSRDGLCLSFIGHVNVCPFSLSRSPRCSRFVFLVFSSLSYFLALIVWGTRGFLLLIFDPLVFIYFPGAAAAAAGRGSPPPPGARRGSVVGLIMCSCLRSEESKRGRGLGHTQFPAPGPRAAPLERYCKNGGSGVCGNDALAVVWARFSGNGAGASVRASFWEVTARILPWVAKWVSRYLQIVL